MTAPEPTPVSPVPTPAPAPWWARYAKTLLAAAGATPPTVVFGWLDSAGIHALPSWAQLAVTGVCALGAVLFGPKNAA